MNLTKLFVSVLFLLIPYSIFAQNVDVQELLKETQKSIQKNKKLIMVWWLPTEFWVESLKKDPSISVPMINDVVKVVNHYTLFVVVDGDIGPFGGITPAPEAEVRKKIRIRLPGGTRLSPLPEIQLSADLKNLFSVMEPMFAGMLGQLGEGMRFLAFKGKNSDGERYINPMNSSKFSVVYGEHKFAWRLPLGSLLPPKIDPETKEEFPGNYNYNPFTGTKLIEKS